jgi:hypothetical protein
VKRTTKLLIGLALLLSLTTLAGVLVATTQNVASATQEATPSNASVATSADAGRAYAEGVIDIVLGDAIKVSGEGATVEGTTVKITAAGIYSISGILTDGQIDVNAKGKVYLEFNGVDITNSSGPALMITDAKKVTLTLVEGTTNSLTDADSGNDNDAALFTNDTLVINGKGTLLVTGNNNEGISSDDDLIINSGTIKVTAVDDGLNAHDDITINSGDVYLLAGGDGLDSNGTVHINGGTLVSFGGTSVGDGGIDARGAFTITDGTVIAGGNSTAAPDNGSTRCSIYVATGSTQAAGTVISVTRDGKDILTFTPDKEYQNVFISSSDLIEDAAYQVYVGSNSTAISVSAAIAPAGAGSADGAPAGAGTAAAPTAGQL